MIIGIDGNEANQQNRVGIGEYAYQLLLQFYKTASIEFHIYLKHPPREDMPKQRPGWKYVLVGPKKLWTQIGLPLYLFTHFPRPDVFFSPTHYAPRFCPIPTAIAVMDVSYLHFPELFARRDLYQLTSWTKYSVKNASRVFTISNASRNDIIQMYQKNPKKVVVTYPGIKNELSNMNNAVNKKDMQKKFGIGENYILFVGTLQPRKNIARLIEAFSMLKNNEEKKIELVIVGKKGWLYEEILAAPQKFGVEEDVKFLEFVGNDDLPSLYKHAMMFVLPSLYEGFGLPVVEAMKYGTPVITSNVSSLPEAGGDGALYVNPEDVNEITKAIQKLLDNPKLREEMVKKGFEQVKKFSWEKTAKETLEVLQQVASNNKA
ncbi:MAG TPA: glycosyltransferase family 1 protein [Candidatus Eisenbacteria bacterium]|nr:glycosyltransferase family 1 protein [Candidatus Eisenbacteria bacterium]